jgi:hypothetical protein
MQAWLPCLKFMTYTHSSCLEVNSRCPPMIPRLRLFQNRP